MAILPGIVLIGLTLILTAAGQSLEELIKKSQLATFEHVNQQYQQQQLQQQFQQQQPQFTQSNASPDPRFDRQLSDEIANSVTNLGQRILQYAGDRGNNKADIISPLSIAAALSMVELGAKGQTFTQLSDILFSGYKLKNVEPWRIHEQFGLLLEDVLNETPNASRPRVVEFWKNRKYEFSVNNRFDFPTESNEYLAPTRSSLIRITPPPPSVQPLFNEVNDYKQGLISREPTTVPENSQEQAQRFPIRRPKPSASLGNNQIQLANAIFVQSGYSIRRDYRSAIEGIYKSEVTPLNFQTDAPGSANHINGWVNEKTHGKIKQIVSSNLSPITQIVIASALYFRAEWQDMFIEGATSKKPFYPDGKEGRVVMADLMAHGGKFPFYESPQYDCRILGLPYKNGQTTMYVILPNDSDSAKLRRLQSQLGAENINDMISKMQMKTAVILFPKLQLTTQYSLKSILTDMGVSSLFKPSDSDLSLISNGHQKDVYAGRPSSSQFEAVNRNGDQEQSDAPRQSDSTFSFPQRNKREVTYKVESSIRSEREPLRLKDLVLKKRITKPNPMKKPHRSRRQAEDDSQFLKNLDQQRSNAQLPNPRIFADAVIHKVDLTVNERGTEGGAATSISLNRSGTDVVFRADTPFMIVIRHDVTKLVLFYGTVYDPTTGPAQSN